MSEWRPIRTAPKKGEEVLLYCPAGCKSSSRAEGMAGKIVVGTWRGRSYGPGGYWICDVTENDFGYYEGDFSQSAIEIKPTHWMPLPLEPVREATASESGAA